MCDYKPRVVSTTTHKTSRPKTSNWWRQMGVDTEHDNARDKAVQHCNRIHRQGTHRRGRCTHPVACVVGALLSGMKATAVQRDISLLAADWRWYDRAVHVLLHKLLTSWATSKPSFRCSNARQETALSADCDQRIVSIKQDSWKQGDQKAWCRNSPTLAMLHCL